MDIGKYQRKTIRMIKRRQALQGNATTMKRLIQVSLAHVRPVLEPLVLISQIQRSGGSLLSQLFDGHPQVHAHPHEIKIGYPKKYNWPPIDLRDPPERWFDLLFEETTIQLFEEGYKKESSSTITFPFIFLPALQKRIFLSYLASISSCRQREVFDAYMTAFFGAWLNNQNYTGPKRVVTGFTPRLSDDAHNMERFFDAYPDGRLISIVRNPKNWYPSAMRHNAKIKKNKYGEIRQAIEQWLTCARAIVRNKRLFGERVCVIRFEDLVQRTDEVMRSLAAFVEIDFDDSLLIPTFNRCPIQANTSFDTPAVGIVQATLARHQTLSAEDHAIIEELTTEAYHEALDCLMKC